MEFKSLQEEPVEGFTVKLINEDLFEWQVAIFGPPSTLYEGAYFKVSSALHRLAGQIQAVCSSLRWSVGLIADLFGTFVA